ncbi:N-acetylglucosamine kinase [Gordonia asplenii]|nr:BadF/BadG/BcrA/BcrD ATPase family protein [Gordonia asplenii]
MAQRIAVDGGQSGTRMRIDGLGEVDAGPIYTDRPLVGQLRGYLSTALADLSGPAEYELAVGISGLTPANSRPDELLAACRELGIVRVALAHDSVSAYLGSNGWNFGAVVAAGTGIVGLGVSADTVGRVDGWGYLFGDAGSAYWIGRAGIAAALRAFDGRAAATTLEALTVQHFGPLPELYVAVQSDPDRVSKVAAFAVVVAAAADDGDLVATQIIDDAADELAHTVCTAARNVAPRWPAPPRISWTGKVITGNDALRARFVERVRASIPDADVAAPLGSPLDGVARLFDAPQGHPLGREIALAAHR